MHIWEQLKPICPLPHLWEVYVMLPLKQFQYLSDWWWPFLVLSRKVVKCFPFLCLSLWVIDDAMSPALSPWVVSEAPRHFRSSEKQASLSAGSFSVTLTCGLSGAVHPQEFPKLDVECWHIPIPLFVASLLNLWGQWHVSSDCHFLRQSSGGHGWLLSPPLSSWRLGLYRLHCLHGRQSHHAWQWSLTLTDLWWTESMDLNYNGHLPSLQLVSINV